MKLSLRPIVFHDVPSVIEREEVVAKLTRECITPWGNFLPEGLPRPARRDDFPLAFEGVLPFLLSCYPHPCR